MRDLYKSIDYIKRGMLRGLDRIDRKIPPAPSSNYPGSPRQQREERSKPSIRAWHAPVSEADAVYPEQVFRPKTKLKDTSRDTPKTQPRDAPMTQLNLTARALKITVPLDPAEVRALPIPDNQTRARLAIACEGKVYTADIATKALRKAKGTISANRVENVFAMVQGKLKGAEIIECGLVAQVKTPKPSSSVPAAAAVSGS